MPDEIVEQVRSKYAAVAASGLAGDHAGVRAIAEAFGYSADYVRFSVGPLRYGAATIQPADAVAGSSSLS